MSATRVKSRRVTQACDFCHQRGVKCKKGPNITRNNEACLTCVEYGQECTRKREPKKRGTKPQALNRRQQDSGGGGSSPSEPVNLTATFNASTSSLNNRKVITTLLDVYLDTVHPR